SGVGGGYATGGPINGPGSGTSDSIPIMASNGEHMFTAAEVQMAGGHDAIYRIRASIRNGDLPAYAAGGAIGSARQLAPAASGPIDYDRLASAIGPGVNLAGANFTALDPAGLKREIMAEIELKLNNKNGVRLV